MYRLSVDDVDKITVVLDDLPQQPARFAEEKKQNLYFLFALVVCHLDSWKICVSPFGS